MQNVSPNECSIVYEWNKMYSYWKVKVLTYDRVATNNINLNQADC